MAHANGRSYLPQDFISADIPAGHDTIWGWAAKWSPQDLPAKIDPAKAKVYRIEKEPDKFAEFLQSMTEREDDDAQSGRDMLSRQAMIQRHWAMQAVADVRALISGAGVRADCLECRGYGAPRAVRPGDDRGLMALLGAFWKG